jgi:hypothetical protein
MEPLTGKCGKNLRGSWECRPRDCPVRETADCPEQLIWDLYKGAKEPPK